MRVLIAAVTAATLLATSALGADLAAPTSGPLAPGKPAGVKQAQLATSTLIWLGLGVTAVVVTAVALSGGHKTATTGTTP